MQNYILKLFNKKYFTICILGIYFLFILFVLDLIALKNKILYYIVIIIEICFYEYKILFFIYNNTYVKDYFLNIF